MSVDNSEIISQFVPASDDGDTFVYTELLDRSKKTGGANRVRMLRTFRHHSRDDFWEKWPTIKTLCDQTGVRAYTRLAPRSYKKVGRLFVTLAVEAAMVEHWKDMANIYSSACGRSAPVRKIWLFDVDEPNLAAEALGSHLEQSGLLLATIPSRKGYHLIARPHDMRCFDLKGISLHKDNPTNLYIPDAAE